MKLHFHQCASNSFESKEKREVVLLPHCLIVLPNLTVAVDAQGPAKEWEEALLSLEVEGSKPGIEGEEIVPLAKENVATP